MPNAFDSDLHRVPPVPERRNDRADMRCAPRPSGELPLASRRDVEHSNDRLHVRFGIERRRDRLGRAAQKRVSGVHVEIVHIIDIRRHATPGEPRDVLQFVLQPREIIKVPERGWPVATCIKIQSLDRGAARAEIDPRAADLYASSWIAAVQDEGFRGPVDYVFRHRFREAHPSRFVEKRAFFNALAFKEAGAFAHSQFFKQSERRIENRLHVRFG